MSVDGREGFVRRPNLVGALISKAAAHTNVGDRDPRRHRRDFLVLSRLVAASDFRSEQLTKSDRRRLRAIVEAIRADRRLLLEFDDPDSTIDRLLVAAGLSEGFRTVV